MTTSTTEGKKERGGERGRSREALNPSCCFNEGRGKEGGGKGKKESQITTAVPLPLRPDLKGEKRERKKKATTPPFNFPVFTTKVGRKGGKGEGGGRTMTENDKKKKRGRDSRL